MKATSGVLVLILAVACVILSGCGSNYKQMIAATDTVDVGEIIRLVEKENMAPETRGPGGRPLISILVAGARREYFPRTGAAITYLALAGASLNTFDDKGLAPLHLALTYRGVPVVETDTVALLIERGANVNQVTNDEFATTPLHYAACNGQLALCKLMVKAGANPEARDAKERTPRMVAKTDEVAWYFDSLKKQAEAAKLVLPSSEPTRR